MHHIGAFQKKRTKHYVFVRGALLCGYSKTKLCSSNDVWGQIFFTPFELSAFSPGFCLSIVRSYFVSDDYAQIEKKTYLNMMIKHDEVTECFGISQLFITRV